MDTNILYLLIAGIIGLIIGYFLGKSIKKSEPLNLTELKHKNTKLQADLDACKSKLSAKGPLAASTSASVVSSFAAAGVAFDADAAKSVFGKRIKENDLTVVEGIGPKIQGLFHNYDVKTWKALSECNVDKCQKVLDSGGDRYKIHNPGTWPDQAKMAYEGKWKELLTWQDELDGGK